MGNCEGFVCPLIGWGYTKVDIEQYKSKYVTQLNDALNGQAGQVAKGDHMKQERPKRLKTAKGKTKKYKHPTVQAGSSSSSSSTSDSDGEDEPKPLSEVPKRGRVAAKMMARCNYSSRCQDMLGK